MSGHHDYRQAKVILDGKTTREKEVFGLVGADVYDNMDEMVFLQINDRYEQILIDLGNAPLDIERMSILERSRNKLLIGDYSLFRGYENIVETIRRLEGMECKDDIVTDRNSSGTELVLLTVFGCPRILRKCEKVVGRRIYRLPLEPDPTRLHRDSIIFFDNLFCQENSFFQENIRQKVKYRKIKG